MKQIQVLLPMFDNVSLLSKIQIEMTNNCECISKSNPAIIIMKTKLKWMKLNFQMADEVQHKLGSKIAAEL